MINECCFISNIPLQLTRYVVTDIMIRSKTELVFIFVGTGGMICSKV